MHLTCAKATANVKQFVPARIFLSRMGEDQGEGDSMMPKATILPDDGSVRGQE
jgi:hypothetical protein